MPAPNAQARRNLELGGDCSLPLPGSNARSNRRDGLPRQALAVRLMLRSIEAFAGLNELLLSVPVDTDRDPAIYTESDHMPAWAKDDPHEYWDAADLFERANGRLYVAADFALPRDLDPDDQFELAHAFAEELTADGHLPYTLAIHAGRDDAGREHNPHAH